MDEQKELDGRLQGLKFQIIPCYLREGWTQPAAGRPQRPKECVSRASSGV